MVGTSFLKVIKNLLNDHQIFRSSNYLQASTEAADLAGTSRPLSGGLLGHSIQLR